MKRGKLKRHNGINNCTAGAGYGTKGCGTFIKENNKKVSELDDKEKKLTKQEAKELLGIIEVLDEIYNYK